MPRGHHHHRGRGHHGHGGHHGPRRHHRGRRHHSHSRSRSSSPSPHRNGNEMDVTHTTSGPGFYSRTRRFGQGTTYYYSRWTTSTSTTTSYNGGSTRSYQRSVSSSKPAADAAPPKDVLTVHDVDLQIDANTKSHRTDEYDICAAHQRDRKLVVRRGQPFNLQIEFNKPYDKNTDDLRIVFEAGEYPSPGKGTEVDIILSDVDKPKEWGAKILKQQGNTLTLTIFTPPTCFVGKWDFYIDVVKKTDTDTKIYTYDSEEQIYIIFNPWCKDDAVYMEDEKLLEEYVLNESGRVYVGTAKKISARPWNYGQFESCVLDVALYLMDIGRLPWSNRGNPVQVIRKISAAVNSQDEGGILVGNWSGSYGAGIAPLRWTGSVKILEKYWETRMPVKFGQCWVYSSVATSICRALGIPARSITNFASAHDTDGSITIDMLFDKDGNQEKHPDSVWNYHVWNEAYFARPDLPPGYGGWQAFDATPQEESEGTYCCGPCSVAAIKQGEVNLPYDGPFVFAEVNADKICWQRDPTGRPKNVYCIKNAIGKCISTKAANNDFAREDVTDQYKCKEGSAGERAAVRKANQLASSRPGTYKETPEDVKFEIQQDAENTWVGQPFEAAVKMTNTSNQTRHVSGTVAIRTMYYTGVLADRLKDSKFLMLELGPGQSETVTYIVQPNEYLDKLKDCCMLDVSVYAKVKETEQPFIDKQDCRLRKPHLNIKSPSDAIKGREFSVEVSFTNPLDVTLTECSISVDGLAKALDFPQASVGPKSTFVAKIPITPAKIGNKEVIFCFGSRQLEDINAYKRLFIRTS